MSRWLIISCLFVSGCVTLGPPGFVPVEESLPEESVDHLALAADALGDGNERLATLYLSAHLYEHPQEAMTRAQLASLLFQQERYSEAALEYERFVAVAQPLDGLPHRHLVQAHTQLMRIAQQTHDEHAEALHRGIGLLTLVQNWDADPKRHDESLARQTLAKAVAALRTARELRPHDARTNWYLVVAYTRLGQPSGARAAWQCLRSAPPLGLTPWETEQVARRLGTERP